MATEVYIYFPAADDMPVRGDMEIAVEDLFGRAARFAGGGGAAGYNLDFALADGEDVDAWVIRLRELLRAEGAGAGTYFDVYPDGWRAGQSWRRVAVFGADRWLTDADR